VNKAIIKLVGISLLFGSLLYATEKRDYEVWGKKDGETVLMPHVAPIIGVKQVSGPPIPEHGSLACNFKQETETTPRGEKVHVLAGYCEQGIVVHVTSIDLNH
jgi:hypothetical protein